MRQTLFERYGGFASVRRMVSDFYDRVLESPTVAHRFEHVEMSRLVDHQSRFISSLMGGPGAVNDDHLFRVHAHLGITGAEFREIVDLLRSTLEDHDLSVEDVAAVIAEVERRESVIVVHP